MGQNLRGTEKIKFDLVEKYENALFFHHKPVIDRFLGVYGLDLNLVITQSDVLQQGRGQAELDLELPCGTSKRLHEWRPEKRVGADMEQSV